MLFTLDLLVRFNSTQKKVDLSASSDFGDDRRPEEVVF